MLDPYALKSAQRAKLVRAYDKFASQRFKRIPDIADDETRGEIDAALMDALGINDDLSVLRRMLAQEPLITGARS